MFVQKTLVKSAVRTRTVTCKSSVLIGWWLLVLPGAAGAGFCNSSQTGCSTLLGSCRSSSGPTCTSPSPAPPLSSDPPRTGSGRWAGSARGEESGRPSPSPGNTANRRQSLQPSWKDVAVAWCPLWHSRVSRCWWRGVSPPEGWPDRTSRDQTVELCTKQIWNKSTFRSNVRFATESKHTGHTCHVTHGACGAVWAAPGDARLHRDAAVGPALHPRMVSSCRVLHPASCSGRRRTDAPAPEQEVQWAERSNLLCVWSPWRTTALLLPPRLLHWNLSSVCWCRQRGWRAFRSHPAAASPALMGPWPSWGRCWRRTNTADMQRNMLNSVNWRG